MNDIDVAEEHFASTTTQQVISQLYPYLERRAPNGLTVVAATVEGNQHELGVRMVADFFEMDGWRSVYLGPSVPANELGLAVIDFQADVLVIAACLHAQIQAVGDTVRVIRSIDGARHVKIIVGGPAFAETGDLWRTFGADGLAATVDEAVSLAAALVRPASASPS